MTDRRSVSIHNKFTCELLITFINCRQTLNRKHRDLPKCSKSQQQQTSPFNFLFQYSHLYARHKSLFFKLHKGYSLQKYSWIKYSFLKVERRVSASLIAVGYSNADKIRVRGSNSDDRLGHRILFEQEHTGKA